MKINVIIFSRDRAMQADTVLRSFFLHCKDADRLARIHVLYMATSLGHLTQYKKLSMGFPQVDFVQQTNFRNDTLRLLNPYDNSRNSYQIAAMVGRIGFRSGSRAQGMQRRYIDIYRTRFIRSILPPISSELCLLFLVDDNIFFRDFFLQPVLDALDKNPCALGFSLRLGRNTSYCYSHNESQDLPPFFQAKGDILKYCWHGAANDFGYPLEISSSIYLASIIIPLLLSVNFRNPNELEGELAARSHFFQSTHPELLNFDQSVTFCNPVNIVQTVSLNRTGESVHYSVNELLERYERGERVDLSFYNGFVPNGCHQEVPFNFLKS